MAPMVMNKSFTKKSLIFLLGAGFNVDAASEAGNPTGVSSDRPPRYPMIRDLLSDCFGINALPAGRSIEDLFHEKIIAGDDTAMGKLSYHLMEADNFITPYLKGGGGREDNAYLTFLRNFPDAPLLTFNYDSLPEILLLNEGTWCPKDGYGVTVKAEVGWVKNRTAVPDNSRRHVLHLHGTFCIRPADFEIKPSSGVGYDLVQYKSKTEFYFEPDNLVYCFSPFQGYRIAPDPNHTPLKDRVIAPVPDKAKGLKREFIKAVYAGAIGCIRDASQIVAIGYSFNPYDLSSYFPLLKAAVNKSILIVAPDAGSLIGRLISDYKDIRWTAEDMSFKGWVRKEYPGLKNNKSSA